MSSFDNPKLYSFASAHGWTRLSFQSRSSLSFVLFELLSIWVRWAVAALLSRIYPLLSTDRSALDERHGM